jgi:diadenosine tetraphosphate (Ap4A) HIT family hydrolase
MSPEDAAALIQTAQKIAKAILKLDGVQGYNLLQNNGFTHSHTLSHTLSLTHSICIRLIIVFISIE